MTPLLKRQLTAIGTRFVYEREILQMKLSHMVRERQNMKKKILVFTAQDRMQAWAMAVHRAQSRRRGRSVRSKNALGAFDYDYLGDSGRITGMALAGTALKRGYAYTSAPENLITTLTETTQGQSRQWHYDYDEIDRLTGADSSDGKTYRYWLDAGDNLTPSLAPKARARRGQPDRGLPIRRYTNFTEQRWLALYSVS
jgi:YD repeat-containing protein